MSEWPKPGDKMRFMNRNGYDHQLEEARKVFTTDQILTVKSCNVGRSDHRISFEEYPERSWNGVMFEFINNTNPKAGAPEHG